MSQKSMVAKAAALAVGGALSMTAFTTAHAQQRVEVTGTNIKRIDTETVAPVQIITRDQIERTGQPTIAEVIRSLPSNLGSYSEVFSNSFAPGAAGVSLRGLGQKATLVLINGRRTAGYGYAQNISDSFVDLNAIPASAVERIEVLKDGASAIYGSDAIAGVVNLIMRKDYRGVEFTANAGRVEGNGDYKATVTFGMGDIGKDKYNVFGSLDFFHRDLLLQSETAFTKDRDFRGREEGGRNFQALTSGGTFQIAPITNPVTGAVSSPNLAVNQQFRSITECLGKKMTGPEAVEAGLINLSATPQNPNLSIFTARAAPTNTFCTFNFASQLPALPGTDRLNGFLRGTYEFSPSVTAYTEVGLSRTDTFQVFTSPFFQTTGLTTTPLGLRPFTFQQNYPAGVAGNPFAGNARFSGNLISEGTRDNRIVSENARVVAGVLYTVGNWDFDSAFGAAKSTADTNNINRVTLSGAANIFGITTAPQPPTPTVTNSKYNYDKPSTNAPGTFDIASVDFHRVATSELSFLDTRASTTFGKLPGGPVGLAVGAEHRRESIRDRPAEVAKRGDVLGQGIVDVDGSRNNTSLFTELSLPVRKDTEFQLAARHDRYSDYGTSTTPKIGAKFRPMDGVLVRANWGKGFRAPTLPEISNAVATFFSTISDPQAGGGFVQYSGVYSGNANLKPETSTTKTLGLVLQPANNISFGASLYDISWRNVVANQDFNALVTASCPVGGPTAANPCFSTANVTRDSTTNFVSAIVANYVNVASRSTRGYDLDASIGIPTDFGRVGLRGDLTYVRSFKEDGNEVAGTAFASSIGSIPKLRTGLSANVDRGPLSVTTRVNYTGGYESFFQLSTSGPGYFNPQDPRFQTGVLPKRVSVHRTFDLYMRYAVNRKLTANLGIINLSDARPPYDPVFGNFTDTQLYDLRGRQVRAGIRYTL